MVGQAPIYKQEASATGKENSKCKGKSGDLGMLNMLWCGSDGGSMSVRKYQEFWTERWTEIKSRKAGEFVLYSKVYGKL